MTRPLDANIAKADAYLARFKQQPLGHFIAGRRVQGDSARTFENISPIDASVLNTIVAGTPADIAAAANAAQAAFKDWAAMKGSDRRKLLHKVADLIEARAEEIAFLECIDTGQALRFMSKAALRGAENFRFFADRAPEAANGLSMPAHQHMNYSVRSPIGPVATMRS